MRTRLPYMDFLEGKDARGESLNAMLGHAVDAAQITAVGKRYAPDSRFVFPGHLSWRLLSGNSGCAG